MSNLVPWNMHGSMDDIRKRIMRVFDRKVTQRRDSTEEESPFFDLSVMAAGPAIDIDNNDDEVVVTVELPGLDEKDFHIELQGNRLIMSGEKKASREEKKGTYSYTERRYGSFYRAVPLPAEVDASKTEAKYKNGVLQIHLPKTEEAKKQTVRVKVE